MSLVWPGTALESSQLEEEPGERGLGLPVPCCPRNPTPDQTEHKEWIALWLIFQKGIHLQVLASPARKLASRKCNNLKYFIFQAGFYLKFHLGWIFLAL